jgi:hypothetical protein
LSSTQLILLQLRSELRAAGLGLNHVDKGRRISPTQSRRQDSKFLLRALVQGCAVEAGFPGNCLKVTELSLGRWLIRSNGGHRSGLLPFSARAAARSRGSPYWRVNDPTYSGAELKVRTELRSKTERGEGTSDRFGLGFLQIVSEIAG